MVSGQKYYNSLNYAEHASSFIFRRKIVGVSKRIISGSRE